MRSLSRMRQKVWYAKPIEKRVGIDIVPTFSVPVMDKLAVTATAGNANDISAGLVPDYDRVVISYKKLPIEEGYVFWIDKVPELYESGELAVNEEQYAPITPPDYMVKRILTTQKSLVVRYGIVKIVGNT